jgi:hypothetical protein
MKKRQEQGLQLLALAIVFLLITVITSCQSLNPFEWGGSNESASEPTNAITGTISDVTDSALDWAWMLILLSLFFKQVREPIVGLLTAVFAVLTLPFTTIIDKYKNK